MSKPISQILFLLLSLTWIGVCGSSIYYINSVPSETPVTVSTPTPAPSLTPASIETVVPASTLPPMPSGFVGADVSPASETGPDTGWSLIRPGLERRLIEIDNAQNQPVESVHVWRLDQKYFRFDVAHAETPKTLETWQKETNASMVVNGGYYSIANERYFPDGLTVSNGKASGRSFAGFGGMLAINETRAELRWLVEKPYDSYEPLKAALQSFPILVQPGGKLGFGPERENHVRARRTVLAQDRDGRIIFIIAPQGYFTLHQLSVYLTESDLNLDIAVNLDGGGSTGILVANPRESIPPTRPIPFVILVYPR